MRRIHCLIKPASGSCNMICQYCFYKDEGHYQDCIKTSRMSFDTMKNIIEKSLAKDTRSVVFAFQGGEPTLAGLDYFKEFVAMVKKQNLNQCNVTYALQTNGYQLEADWFDFFSENEFLIGVSLDGTEDIHNHYRKSATGENTFKAVMKTIEKLNENKIDFNILTVVHREVALNIKAIFKFYQDHDFSFQQYIPCFDPLYQNRGELDYSITPALYGQFLMDLFDCWYDEVVALKAPYNRYFENLLGLLIGQPPEQCGMLGQCVNQYVFEADGSVYPCDFYAMDEYCLGNINQDSFIQLDASRKQMNFIGQSQKIEETCKDCTFYYLCKGGCRRDRQQRDGSLNQNYFCESYKTFFAYALPRLNKLAQAIVNQNSTY